MHRFTPDISIEATDGYAALLGHNWDTIQECFNLNVSDELEARLEAGKVRAQSRFDDQGDKFEFGGKTFQIQPKGTKGKSWVLSNDDFIIMFGRGAKDWKVSVRYLAAGLWEYGFEALKVKILTILLRECKPEGKEVVIENIKTWQRLSRADYAFDFYAPEFSKEMERGNIREKLVLPSGVKGGLVFDSNKDETLTLGMNRTGLQIQVYDKGKEITDISGKTWMYTVWEREGFYPPEDQKAKHIWRVEIRFGKEFFKDRGILLFEELEENLQFLLCEALFKRRIGEPDRDSNKARWALHPLWAATYEASGLAGRYCPIGRQSTLSAQAKLEIMKKGLAGTVRAAVILKVGDYDDLSATNMAYQSLCEMEDDKRHQTMIEKVKERYRYEGDAR